MKFNSVFNNFSSGEWSPLMRARTGTDQYANACEKMKNMMALMQGGAFRRAGFGKVAVTATITPDTMLLPFVISTGQRFLVIADPSGWVMKDVDAGTEHTPIVSPTAVIPTNPKSIHYAQIADALFFVSDDRPPMVLLNREYATTASGVVTYHTDWYIQETYENFATYGDPLAKKNAANKVWSAYPFGPIQSDNIDGTIKVTGTLTAGSTVTLVSTNNQFNAGMASSTAPRGLFKLTKGGQTGMVQITSYTSATSASGIVLFLLPGTSPVTYGSDTGTAFQKAMWNGGDGYPQTLAAYEGRMFYGGNSKNPDTLWGSRIGNAFDMDEVPFAQDDSFTTFTDDNSRPFTLVPSMAETSKIQALSSAKTLTIHTQLAEIVASGTQSALGPNDFDLESSTSYGAAHVQPRRVNNYLSFVQRDGRKLRDIVFSWEEQQYKSNDLSFIAEHLTLGSSVAQMQAAEFGSSFLFVRLNSGKLIGVTVDRDYSINAWCEFEIGGVDVSVDGVVCVANESGAYDDAFILVTRLINGATVTYLEKYAGIFEFSEFTVGGSYPCYMDSFLHATAASTNTWSVTHLKSSTVSVIGDGFYMGEFDIDSSGQLTLPKAITDLIVGFKYQSILRPMPIEKGQQSESVTGRDKRANELYMRFHNTLGCRYGLVGGEKFDIAFRDDSVPADQPTPLFSGDKRAAVPNGYDKTYKLEFETDQPFPMNILGFGIQGMSYD